MINNETFQNAKGSFIRRRLNGRNFDSKRLLKVADIDGAEPTDHHSITKSKRIKMTSSDMKDLLDQVDKYRKRVLSKNGVINLFSKGKSNDSSAK